MIIVQHEWHIITLMDCLLDLLDLHADWLCVHTKRTCLKESYIVIANTNKIFQRFTSLCQFVRRVISAGLHFIRLHDGIISLRGEVWDDKTSLRGYNTLQGDISLKSVERFDHMMFVCRFQASRWSKLQREKLLCG